MAHTEPGSPAGRLPPEPHTLRLVLFDDVDELDQGATAAAEWRITGGPVVRAALLGALNQAVAELETRYAAALRAASEGRGGRATPQSRGRRKSGAYTRAREARSGPQGNAAPPQRRAAPRRPGGARSQCRA